MRSKLENFMKTIQENPFKNPPPYEKLGGMHQTYSRRLNAQHRLVYDVLKEENIVKITRIWTHYE